MRAVGRVCINSPSGVGAPEGSGAAGHYVSIVCGSAGQVVGRGGGGGGHQAF